MKPLITDSPEFARFRTDFKPTEYGRTTWVVSIRENGDRWECWGSYASGEDEVWRSWVKAENTRHHSAENLCGFYETHGHWTRVGQ